MKKLQNFLFLYSIALLCSQNLLQASNGSVSTVTNRIGGGQGFIANDDWRTQQSQQTTTQGTTCPSGTTAQCCANGCATSQNNSNYSIPPFTIQITGNKPTTIMNGSTSYTSGFYLNVPSGFQLNNAILTVHIFPPSNIVSSSTVQYASGNEATYTYVYTLKDPAGSVIFSDYNTYPAPQGSDVPHYINIIPVTQPTQGSNLATIAIPSGSSFACQAQFFPVKTKLSQANKQMILNGISPITQKFLLSMGQAGTDANNNPIAPAITITQISGTYDADDSQTYRGISPSPSSTTTATTGANVTPISISFDKGQTQFITFESQATPLVPFTTQDLANGLILNVVIFPQISNNYPVVATLRTIDGLKMRKKHMITQSTLSTLSQTITILNDANNTLNNLLTTSFLSSQAIADENLSTLFNIISPLNLRFLISRPINGTNFMVLMV